MIIMASEKSNGVLEDVEVGQKYKGSVVTMIDEEVVDGPRKFHIKRQISLENGAILSDEYWQDKKGSTKTPGQTKSSPIKKATKKGVADGGIDHKAAARAKAKALMAAKRKS